MLEFVLFIDILWIDDGKLVTGFETILSTLTLYSSIAKFKGVNPLRVQFNLNNIECFDESDGPGNAEPYLWTVFFKIDGDTVKVNNRIRLEGTATVVGTPGNHEDLDADYDEGIDAGDIVPIPGSIGKFQTVLKPIPISFLPDKTIGGIVGCLAILMEEDFTPDDAIAKGHEALNKSVRDTLNGLIPTFGLGHTTVTEEDIIQMEEKIISSVTTAIKDEISFWDVVWQFLTFQITNPDNQIGTAKIFFSHNQLEKTGENGIPVRYEWNNDEGHWALNGSVKVTRLLASGIYRSGDWTNRLLVGLDTNSFLKETQKLFDEDGLRLVNITTYVDNGQRKWAGISRSGDWTNRFLHDLSISEFRNQTQKLFDEDGLRLTDVTTYVDNGQRKWAGISRSGTWANRFKVSSDLNLFLTETQQLFDKKGLRIEGIELTET